MTGRVVIGVDGGGSKSLVVVADVDGLIIRRGRGGGVNPIDNRHWRETLIELLAPLAGQPGLSGVAAALPAYGEVEAVSQEQRGVIAELFDGVPQRVLNDVDAAQIGAFAGGPGILILSGTGSMAWARDAAGRSRRVGGWGEVIGDEGSSHWIGQRVLSRISKSLDGRAEPTALVDEVFRHIGLDPSHPMDALEGWVARQGNLRAEVAAIAMVAGRLADAGHPTARGIFEEAACELATHHRAIAEASDAPATWSYAGGTFGCRTLLEALTARIGERPVVPALPPVGGAVLAATRLLDRPVALAFVETLAASMSGTAAGEEERPDA